MRNQLVPLNVYHSNYNLFASKELYLKQMDYYAIDEKESRGAAIILSPQEWQTQLQDYEYVVLFSINDVF